MAEYRDVATDQDIIEIANQIRRITQSDRRMTIPEMLEALETLPRNAGLMFNDVRVSNWIEDTTGSGYFAVSISTAILPFALAFAGGTMLYVISDEMIPETHHDHESSATYALLVGFCVMLISDVLLG